MPKSRVWCCCRICSGFEIAGAALQPFRGTRPLLQGIAISCRRGLVPRKGRKAPPAFSSGAGYQAACGSDNHPPASPAPAAHYGSPCGYWRR
ncbi:hypothetical protein DMX06_13700 [Pseudomonas mosselii]|nr:hypothetical protein DMX06_13700 [Pseudomonas mosselii]